MNYINMFFNMWFMLVSLITVWTFESLSFMNWFYLGFKVYTFVCLIVTLRAWKWSFEWTMNWFYVCLDWVLILLLLWDVLMWVWSCPTCWAEYLQSSWRHLTWPIIFYMSFNIPLLKQNLLQVYWLKSKLFLISTFSCLTSSSKCFNVPHGYRIPL